LTAPVLMSLPGDPFPLKLLGDAPEEPLDEVPVVATLVVEPAGLVTEADDATVEERRVVAEELDEVTVGPTENGALVPKTLLMLSI